MQATVTGETGFYADFNGLAQLRGQVRQGAAGVETEVARQFEALFIQLMLKAMRDAVPEGGLFDSQGMEFHTSMFDQQVSLHLARRGGMGLADNMARQLGLDVPPTVPGGQVMGVNPFAARFSALRQSPSTENYPAEGSSAEGSSVQDSSVEAARQASNFKGSLPATPEAFTATLWPHARRAAERLGISPEVLVAQAALESGWGRKVISFPGGSSSFNLFGIKADAGWGGGKVAVNTLEYRNGVAVREKAVFRAYDSLAAAFDDYVDFLQSQPRYQQLLQNSATDQQFALGLQQAGYATDPRYATKIQRILNSDTFRQAVAGWE